MSLPQRSPCHPHVSFSHDKPTQAGRSFLDIGEATNTDVVRQPSFPRNDPVRSSTFGRPREHSGHQRVGCRRSREIFGNRRSGQRHRTPPLRGRLQPPVAPTLILLPKNCEQAAPTVLVKDVKFVATLGNISSDILLLPKSTGTLQGLEKREEIAVASGGTTDIWRGTWNGQRVAFKAFRIYPPQNLQEAKRILWKLVPVWKRLVHENVLSFHGVTTSIFQLALVYDWGHKGNIMGYLESDPDASRPELVRIRLPSARGTFSDQFLSCYKLPKDFNTSILSGSSTAT